MKPSVVYLNFALDEDWAGDDLAPLRRVRSPLALPFAAGLDELGLFFCEPGSYLISAASPDLDFLRFLEKFGIGAERIHPEEISGTGSDFAGRPLIIAGLGLKENALQYLISHQVRTAEIENHRRWNSKVFLFETARALNIPFPESIVIGMRPGFVAQKLSAGSWLFKADHSAGGTGILRGGADPQQTLETIARIMEKPTRWLAQRELERETDYYALARVDEEVSVDAILDLRFDERHASYRHEVARGGPGPEAMREAALKLGEELKRRGYRGYFGTDGFRARDQVIYPAVDLNVRLDKARAIFSAAGRLGLSGREWISLRRRYHDFRPTGFRSLWGRVRSRLALDESGKKDAEFCIPYLFTSAGRGAAEIQWFVSPALESVATEAMDFAAKTGEDG